MKEHLVGPRIWIRSACQVAGLAAHTWINNLPMARPRRPLPPMVLEGPIFRPGRSVSARSALQTIPSPDVPDHPACRLRPGPRRARQSIGSARLMQPRDQGLQAGRAPGALLLTCRIQPTPLMATPGYSTDAFSPSENLHRFRIAKRNPEGLASIHKQYSICNSKLQEVSPIVRQLGLPCCKFARIRVGRGRGRGGGNLVGGGCFELHFARGCLVCAPVGADEVLGLLSHFVEQGLSIAVGLGGAFAQIDVLKVQAPGQIVSPFRGRLCGLSWRWCMPGWMGEGAISDKQEEVQNGQAFNGGERGGGEPGAVQSVVADEKGFAGYAPYCLGTFTGAPEAGQCTASVKEDALDAIEGRANAGVALRHEGPQSERGLVESCRAFGGAPPRFRHQGA